jgi:hypothetical protein
MARNFLEDLLRAVDFFGDPSPALKEDEQVRVRMIADGVALCHDTPEQVGVSLHISPANKERGGNLVLTEDREDLFGKR